MTDQSLEEAARAFTDAMEGKQTDEARIQRLATLNEWRTTYGDHYVIIELTGSSGSIIDVLVPALMITNPFEVMERHNATYLWCCNECAALTLNPETHDRYHGR